MNIPLFLKQHRLKIGGFAGILGIQYFIAEFIAANAWATPYNWSRNYISDLGVPECLNSGQLDRIVCSPLHDVMNTGFMLQAIIVAVVTICLIHILSKPWRYPIAIIAAVYCIGLLLVGLFPGSVAENLGGDSTRMMMHGIGALMAILGGNILVITTALSVRTKFPDYAIISLLLGIVGLTASLSFAAQIDLGFGIGTLERVAVDPIVVWTMLTGAVILAAIFGRSRTPERFLPQ
ncbi:DUF998 domain-containing protein [bacterium]|nr:MAG: DUF998 domain-containing protein [bacterium]